MPYHSLFFHQSHDEILKILEPMLQDELLPGTEESFSNRWTFGLGGKVLKLDGFNILHRPQQHGVAITYATGTTRTARGMTGQQTKIKIQGIIDRLLDTGHFDKTSCGQPYCQPIDLHFRRI